MQKLQLILAGPYQACINTEKIWTEACTQFNLEIEITNLDEERGRTLEKSLNIKSFPAFIVDNQVKAVGHPDRKTAYEFIRNLSAKEDIK